VEQAREGRKNRRKLLDGERQEKIKRGKGTQQMYEKGKGRMEI
jgi:hypothetical protein